MNTFSLPTRLYSGRGSLDVLTRFTNRHIWIICDGFLAQSPLINTLRDALPTDNRISIFSDITPDPTIGTVVQGIAQMHALRPDVVIGFGGDRRSTRQKPSSGSAVSSASKLKPVLQFPPPAAPVPKSPAHASLAIQKRALNIRYLIKRCIQIWLFSTRRWLSPFRQILPPTRGWTS